MLTRGRLSSKPRPGWDRVKKQVWARAKGQCEVSLELADWRVLQMRGLFLGIVLAPGRTRCPDEARDCHHVVKRSQGGQDDPSNVVAICRVMHDLTDRALALGKLVIEPVPQKPQEFTSRVDVKKSKWSW